MKFDHFGKHFHPKYKFIYSFFYTTGKKPEFDNEIFGTENMLPYKWRCCCGKNWHSYCFIAQHIGSRVDDSALPMMILIFPRGLLYCSVVVVVMPSSQSLFMPGICIFLSKLCAYNIWYFSVDGNFRVTFFSLPFTLIFSIRQSISEYDRKLPTRYIFYHLRECNFLLIFHRNDMISSRNVYYS